jgi:transposase
MEIEFASGTRLRIAGAFDGLSLLVQEKLKRDPHNGHLFVFRGRRGSLIKVLWHDVQGMCLFAKRLERGAPRRVFPRKSPRIRFDATSGGAPWAHRPGSAFDPVRD